MGHSTKLVPRFDHRTTTSSLLWDTTSNPVTSCVVPQHQIWFPAAGCSTISDSPLSNTAPNLILHCWSQNQIWFFLWATALNLVPHFWFSAVDHSTKAGSLLFAAVPNLGPRYGPQHQIGFPAVGHFTKKKCLPAVGYSTKYVFPFWATAPNLVFHCGPQHQILFSAIDNSIFFSPRLVPVVTNCIKSVSQ
jgi:hypothetical protein